MRKLFRSSLWFGLVLFVHHVVLITSLLTVALTFVAIGGGWEAWNSAPTGTLEVVMIYVPALLTGMLFARLAGLPCPERMLPLALFVYWAIPVGYWLVERTYTGVDRAGPVWLLIAFPFTAALVAYLGWRVAPKVKAASATAFPPAGATS